MCTSFTAPCTSGQLRLAGGNSTNEGRVEICMNNVWGTVCDDSWGNADATVACRQLGYSTQGQCKGPCFKTVWVTIKQPWPTDAVAFSSSHFGTGTGPIHLDDVDCSGSENNLTECLHSSNVNCTNGHSEDAGVRCQGILLYAAICIHFALSKALCVGFSYKLYWVPT